MGIDVGKNLESLKRKYSHYGEIFDFDAKGSTEESTVSWDSAKTIALMRDGYSCRVCGKSPVVSEKESGYNKLRLEVEVHHIIPRVAGGSDSTKNLITLCKRCHVKTFKNEYSGLPSISDDLTKRIEIFTNSEVLKKKGVECSDFTVERFYYNGKEIKEGYPLNCSICKFQSLKKVYDIIFSYGLDVEEIITKNKKEEYCLGIIERYSP